MGKQDAIPLFNRKYLVTFSQICVILKPQRGKCPTFFGYRFGALFVNIIGGVYLSEVKV